MAGSKVKMPHVGGIKPKVSGPPRGPSLNRVRQRPPRLVPRSQRNYAKDEVPMENTDMPGGGFGDTGMTPGF